LSARAAYPGCHRYKMYDSEILRFEPRGGAQKCSDRPGSRDGPTIGVIVITQDGIASERGMHSRQSSGNCAWRSACGRDPSPIDIIAAKQDQIGMMCRNLVYDGVKACEVICV
jgi:hypothetical protein